MTEKDYPLEQNWLGSAESGEDLPEQEIPDEAMNPTVAKQLIQHFRLNEAKADQNLTTFCTTQMEPEADELMKDAMNTNAIDKTGYPKTAAMCDRCVAMIGHMWGIPKEEKFPEDFIGTSTVGSSEGFMLGGLGMLFTWKHRAKAAGININDLDHHRPNLIIGSGYQVVWRKNNYDYLPKELRFSVQYLGKTVDSIAINFSCSGANIVGQYYNLIRFGKAGYRACMENVRKVSEKLSKAISDTGYFNVITDGSQLPIVTWEFKKDVKANWTLYDVQDALKMFGWQVPAYPLPKNREDEIIQRIVVRPAMDMTIANDFIADLGHALDYLNKK